MVFRNPKGYVDMAHTNTSRYQIEEKNPFPNKTKHMVLGIKFQTYTTLISILIPNPYHYINQIPLKYFALESYIILLFCINMSN